MVRTICYFEHPKFNGYIYAADSANPGVAHLAGSEHDIWDYRPCMVPVEHLVGGNLRRVDLDPGCELIEVDEPDFFDWISNAAW